MNRKDKPQQTLTGLIRSRLESYEARQFEGVTQKTLAEELTNEGRTISYSNFRTLYARAKKQLSQTKNQPQKKEIAPAPTPVPTPTPPKIDDVLIKETHKPTDLDEIANSEPDLKKYSNYARGKK